MSQTENEFKSAKTKFIHTDLIKQSYLFYQVGKLLKDEITFF